ncbi:MAG: serine/threonine-protein kinase Nek [archaeon]|nr:serine/threonine-protein kinase Nek [archaeon]
MMIREYLIKDKIGTGSYGTVYKVTKKGESKEVYVLKQISLFGLTEKQKDEVRDEAKILSQLNYHYIVKYHDSFEEKNMLNIVMEYCDAGDLDGLINKQKNFGKFKEIKIWEYFLQISLGLGYLHKKNVLHRDLKSLNIFLTKDRGIKIGDLGVAKLLTQGNFAKTFIGTPYYLSPEICEEKPYNNKSDVWALGCILYEMCTFKHPFDAKSQGALILKIVKGKYEPIGKGYSDDMISLVNLVLQKNEDIRPNVKELFRHSFIMKKIRELDMIKEVYELFPDLSKNEIGYSPKMRELNKEEKEQIKSKGIIIDINLNEERKKDTRESMDKKGNKKISKHSTPDKNKIDIKRRSGNNNMFSRPNMNQKENEIGPVTNSFHNKDISKNMEYFKRNRNEKEKGKQKEAEKENIANKPKVIPTHPSKQSKKNVSNPSIEVREFPDKYFDRQKEQKPQKHISDIVVVPYDKDKKSQQRKEINTKGNSPYEIGKYALPNRPQTGIQRINIIDKPSENYRNKRRDLFDEASSVTNKVPLNVMIQDYKKDDHNPVIIKNNNIEDNITESLMDNPNFHKPIPLKDEGKNKKPIKYPSSENLKIKETPPTISYDQEEGRKMKCTKICYDSEKTYKTLEDKEKIFQRNEKGKPKSNPNTKFGPKYVTEDNFTDSEGELSNEEECKVMEKKKENILTDEEDSPEEKETVEVSNANKYDSDSDEVEEKAICFNDEFQRKIEKEKENKELKTLQGRKELIESKIKNLKKDLYNLIGKEGSEFVLNSYKSNSNSGDGMDDDNICECIEFEINKKFPDKFHEFQSIFCLLISNDIQLEKVKENLDNIQKKK